MDAQTQVSSRKRGRRDLVRYRATAVTLLLLLIVVVTLLAGKAARASLRAQYPPAGQLVDVGGYRLHLNCTGSGTPTVVMDTGARSFSPLWGVVPEEVARFTRVCVYDRAGLGWSEPGPAPRTSETMVSELHTLLANAGVEEPYLLVGHSFGGLRMRLYAHHYADEVTGLVLVDSVHEEQDLRLVGFKEANEQATRQFRRLAWLRTAGIVALMPEKVPNPGLSQAAFEQYAAILATTRYFEVSNAETAENDRSFREARAAAIGNLGDTPLVVLTRGLAAPLPGLSPAENEQNEQAWREMQAELAALSSNSRHIIAEQSGHNIPLDEPELVVEAIRQVVAQVPGSTLAAHGEPSTTTARLAMAQPMPASMPPITPQSTPPAVATPTPSPEPVEVAPLVEVTFTLRTEFEAGRMLFVGVGAGIDGLESPDLVVAPGTVVRTVLVNGDGIPHDIYFPDFAVQSAKVSRKGTTAEIVFTVSAEQAPGSYVYYCTLPGHREAGQEGWLIVDAGQ